MNEPLIDAQLAFIAKFLEKNRSRFLEGKGTPFQTYFESGFPHGKDQFISITATAWGVTALALACQ